MKNRFILIIFFVFLFFLFSGFLKIFEVGIFKNTKNIEEFAKCLTATGVVMYGANWCSHCEDQKKIFGDYFYIIDSVDCMKNSSLCAKKGIQGFPTWEFSDGEKFIGKQSLEKLSLKTGCPLP